jgi:hypothetical protein
MRTECLDCNKSLEDCTCIEDTIDFTEADIETFIDGIENPAEPNQALKDAAKWQQERMYSEEDMKKAFNAGEENVNNCYTYMPFEEWFEQFKNKTLHNV